MFLSVALGFGADPARNMKTVADWIERALKKNGPVAPPKKLRPLVKLFEKGKSQLEKKRPGYAWKEFDKVVKLGSKEKAEHFGAQAKVASWREQLKNPDAAATGSDTDSL